VPHGRPAAAATVRVGREAPPRLAECPCSRAPPWGSASPCSSST
jgi:hypothetical protein